MFQNQRRAIPVLALLSACDNSNTQQQSPSFQDEQIGVVVSAPTVEGGAKTKVFCSFLGPDRSFSRVFSLEISAQEPNILSSLQPGDFFAVKGTHENRRFELDLSASNKLAREDIPSDLLPPTKTLLIGYRKIAGQIEKDPWYSEQQDFIQVTLRFEPPWGDTIYKTLAFKTASNPLTRLKAGQRFEIAAKPVPSDEPGSGPGTEVDVRMAWEIRE